MGERLPEYGPQQASVGRRRYDIGKSKLATRQSGQHDVEMSDAPEGLNESEQTGSSGAPQQELHPLLKVSVPHMPSPEEIEALLAAPPLSYNAARAAPSASTAPPRQFCEICGYWGRVRCMKCGTRVCSLECQRQHDDSSCQKFWA